MPFVAAASATLCPFFSAFVQCAANIQVVPLLLKFGALVYVAALLRNVAMDIFCSSDVLSDFFDAEVLFAL